MNLSSKKMKIYLVLTFIISSILIAQSGSVKSITNKAVSDYESGNYTSAIENMEKVLDIMKNKQGNTLNKLLPQTLPGWTRGENSSRSFDPGGLDGGHLVEQTYNKGNGYITAAIILDAPMVDDVREMLNNARANESRLGYKLESIANKRALVRYYDDQNQGEITILANSTAIAAIYGKNVTLREMLNYARLFKFSEISKVK